MSLIGLQTYLAFKIKFLLPNKKFFFISFLLGLIIPEIDVTIISLYNLLLSAENTTHLFDKNFTHSIVTLSVIYLIFLVVYELKKNKEILNVGNGIILGMLIIKGWNYSKLILNLLMGLEFIFFRLLASELVKLVLNNPSKTKDDKFIKYLLYWMKLELLFLILFTFTVIYKPDFQLILFTILYIISYLMTIFSLFNLRKIII